LRKLILEDASKLKQRQETDTIDIIDDLRYAINDTVSLNNANTDLNVKITSASKNFINSFDLLIEKEKRLNLVDKILNELNLEC
jgi:ankyrin repeat/BTB/POZ domain-containing protein 1